MYEYEKDLAADAVEHFKKEGWEVFEEVAPYGGGGKRADIVCKKGDEVIVVECKLQLNWTVLGQADYWSQAVPTWICVPGTIGYRSTRSIAQRCVNGMGMGLIELTRRYNWKLGKKEELHISEHPPKEFAETNKHKTERLTKMLTKELQDFDSNAGTAGGGYWTPFKQTCLNVIGVVAENPDGLSVKDVVEKITHHYASEKSARGAISKSARDGLIKGVSVEYKGRTPYLVKKS